MLLSSALRIIGFALIATTSNATADPVDNYIREQMSKQHISGAAVAVIKSGKLVKQRTYGFANVELQSSVTPKSVFKIGSLSKQVIAAGVMLLVADGKLSLDDPVSKYLPDAPPEWDGISVEHLLSHTSGLVREAPGYDAQKIQSDSVVIRSAYPVPLRFAPGERFEYSNLGYFVLAEIIRVVSKQQWPDFFDERIFKPLGMLGARVTDSAAIVPDRAAGYVYETGAQQNAAQQVALRPSGAFMASLNDLIVWNDSLDSARLLPKSVIQRMWTAKRLNGGGSANYGFGWYVEALNNHRIIRHGGSISGFRSELAKFVDDKVTVIVLTNAETARTDAIALGIASHYVPQFTASYRPLNLSRDQLQKYSGEYRTENGEVIHIAANGTGVDAGIPHFGPPISFVPASPGLFYSDDDLKLTLGFTRDEAGQVNRISVRSDGVEKLWGRRY